MTYFKQKKLQSAAGAFLLLLSCALLLVGCGEAARSSAPSQPETEEPAPIAIRIMCYNIRHGRGMDGIVDIERIAEVINREKPDIVGLQEVDRGVERTDRRDLPRELAELTGMEVFFDRNIIHQGGDYGNAVLTRFPILQQTNTHLRMLRPGEQRGVIEMVLDLHGRKLLFMNTHIDYRGDDAERLMNVEQFKEIIAQYPDMPIIMVGDFNDDPGSRTHTNMKEKFNDVWELVGEGAGYTIPSDNPRKRIDYIWLSKGSDLTPLKAWIPETLASDHLPLVADVTLK